jgi:Zn-dependent protease
MSNGLTIGRLAGIPIRLRLSFLLLLALVAIAAGGLGGVFLVLLTFASVVAHEMGHALVARQLDVRIAAIDLHFLGGAALMVDPPRRARDEIAIALAGPMVSLALAGLGFGLGAATGVTLLAHLGWVNLILGVFNLIPALPMDGGRVLRAALAGRQGYARATETAVKVSRVFAVVFVVAALALGHLQLALIAGLVWLMASAERRMIPHGGYRDEPEVEVLDPWGYPRPRVYRWRASDDRW